MPTPSKTRTLVELVNEPPTYFPVLKKAAVLINSEEAQILDRAKAKLCRTRSGREGQKLQELWYGGKYYVWIARVTTDSPTEPFPIKRRTTKTLRPIA